MDIFFKLLPVKDSCGPLDTPKRMIERRERERKKGRRREREKERVERDREVKGIERESERENKILVKSPKPRNKV